MSSLSLNLSTGISPWSFSIVVDPVVSVISEVPALTSRKYGGFKQTKPKKKTKTKKEVFKITCNFNETKLARNREIAQLRCQNGQKCLQKQGASLWNREGWHLLSVQGGLFSDWGPKPLAPVPLIMPVRNIFFCQQATFCHYILLVGLRRCPRPDVKHHQLLN